MYKTKKDVDAHVRLMLQKLKTESERNARGLIIAKLYYKVNEFALAQQYVTAYLNEKEENDQAHKLLGQCYQRLQKPDKALQAFQRSLLLNPKQTELLAEVCKMLVEDRHLNVNKAKYWCDLAESERVSDDSVFTLRLKIMNSESECNGGGDAGTASIVTLLQKSISARPQDVQLRVRLIRHYIEQNKILDAYKYVQNLEMSFNDAFSGSVEWYNAVRLVLNKYEQLANSKKDWEFWLLLIMCLERQVYLSFIVSNNQQVIGGAAASGSITEIANLLFAFDQYLYKLANLPQKLNSQQELISAFLQHYGGQLLLHTASLLFKREMLLNKNNWRETTKMTLPLLMMAYHTEPLAQNEPWMKHCNEQAKSLLQLWTREASFRCAQAGRTLLACVHEEEELLNANKENIKSMVQNFYGAGQSSLWKSSDELISQIRQTCSDKTWRNTIFTMLFCNSDQRTKQSTSFFARSNQFAEPKVCEWPTIGDVEQHEESAQYLKPQSLEHSVYLCLGNANLFYVRAKYFSGLNFSTQNLAFCGAESLNRLDVDTFLYATTIQAKRLLEVERETFDCYHAGNQNTLCRPHILPFANLQGLLCTEEQCKWWLAAYQFYKNLTSDNMAEMRSTLQFGIEAVRGINGPKVDMMIVFRLGDIFKDRAKDVCKPVEKALLEARVENLYKYGLNMLKMNTKGVLEPYRKYFKYAKSNLSAVERQLDKAAEEAVSWLGARYFKTGNYEELIEELSGIRLPFATYYQAEAYRKMDELNKTPKKAKQMFLDRASDCLDQTLQLLKSTQTDPNHPLNSIIQSEIQRLQQQSCSRFANDSIPSNHNNSSTYEDAEATFSPDLRSVNRSRRGTGSHQGNPVSTELESLVTQMANTLLTVKDELIGNMKPEIVSMRQEISSLKGKINELEDAMKKIKISSNPPSRDDASQVLDDLYIIDEALQNMPQFQQQQQHVTPQAHIPNAAQLMYPNAGNLSSPFLGQQQQRANMSLAQNPMAAAAAAYNNHMFNTANNYSPMSYYNAQYMMNAAQGAAIGNAPGLMSQRNPMGVPFIDGTSSAPFNVPASAQPSLLPQPNRDGRGPSNLYGLLNQPQVTTSTGSSGIPTVPPLTPPNTISGHHAPSANTPSVNGNQFNKALNNKPVEKGPPANVVITSSDPLPNPVSFSSPAQQPPLSVTIPSHHIKPSAVTTNSSPSVSNTAPALTQAPTALNLSVSGGAMGTQFPGFAGFGNVANPPETKSLFEGPTTSANTVTPGLFSFKDKIEEANKSAGKLTSEEKGSEQGSFSSGPNKSCDGEDEYDPRPDFQPIIPLPDEVVVKTGEEDEEVMFCHRAKLYRFLDKQWKERGIGDVKILKGKDGLSRLIMRREQVHKLCANHKITGDIMFSEAKNDNKGFIWGANDFADGELRVEKFFIRFKTAEKAQEFRKVFENAQEEYKKLDARDGATAKSNLGQSTPAGSKKDSTPSYSPFGLAKSNVPTYMTSTPLQGGVGTQKSLINVLGTVASTTTTATTAATTVSKSLFSGFNFSMSTTKSTDTKDANASQSPNPFANLKFGVTSAGSVASTTVTTSASPFANVFGKSNNLGTLTSETPSATATSSSPISITNASVDKSNASDAEDDYEPSAEFKPVIPLPALVEVNTGEENDIVLFEHRAKLLRYVKETSEWKERGIGNMKILQDKEDVNKVRLVMRREQVHKLCCNQRLYKDTSFQYGKNLQTALIWAGPDYSENELVTQTMIVRFKTAEVAKQFLDTVLAAQAKMSCDVKATAVEAEEETTAVTKPDITTVTTADSKKEQPKGFGDAFKPKAGSWTCEGCYVTNGAGDLYCKACEAPKDSTVPKKTPENPLSNVKNTFTFGFPATQTSSSQANGPKMAFGTATTSSVAAPAGMSLIPNKSVEPITSSSGFGDKFKPKTGSWNCQACYLSNTGDDLYCKACQAPKDDTVPKKENDILSLSNPGQKFSFGFAAAGSTSAAPGGTSTAAQPLASAAGGFNFGKSTETSRSEVATSVTVKNANSTLGKATFSFTMSKKEGQGQTFSDISSHKKEFSFSMKPKSPASAPEPSGDIGGADGSYDDSNPEEEDVNAYFAPAIPLPDKVDVKTGEEDEDALYSHRAKLFRFVDGEWKERGIGEVKILRHKITKALRVVMRREQVFKICLNHTLNDSVEYKSKGETAWLFATHDFSEGEIQTETFVLRFKTKEIAQEFMQAVKAALAGEALPVVKEAKDEKPDKEALDQITKKLEGVKVDLPLEQPKLELPDKSSKKERKTGSVLKKSALSTVVLQKNEPDKKSTFSFSGDDTNKAKENSGFLFGSNTFGAGASGDQKPLFGTSNAATGSIFGGGSISASGPIFGGGSASTAASTNIFSGKPIVFPTSGPTIFGGAAKPDGGDAPVQQKPLFGGAGGSGIFGGGLGLGAAKSFTGSTFGNGGSIGSGGNTDKSKLNIFSAGDERKDSKGVTFADITRGGSTNENVNEPNKSAGQNNFSFAAISNNVTDFAALAKNSNGIGSGFTKSEKPTLSGFTGLTKSEDAFSNFGKMAGSKNANKSATETTHSTDGNNGGDDEQNTNNDDNYDPHYDPIIELPEEVKFGTGEENEKKLFGERATLYRYDDVNKEWKERGVGEIKILHNAEANTYRLVMRREQIHKLVLNHLLKPEIKFSNMNNNPKSFIWGCLNFAEEYATEGNVEKLAVRFKKLEYAEQFKKTIDESLAGLKAAETAAAGD